MWLGPMREKRAAAEREEQRAADLKKVKHDSAQPTASTDFMFHDTC